MKRLMIVTGLILIMLLVPVSCAQPSPAPAIKTLTGSEKNAMVITALAHPEVSKWLETAEVYGIEIGWSIVSWNNSEATGWASVAYEEIADGSFPPSESFPPESTSIHPDVLIRLRNPPRMHIDIAFDRKTLEVVAVQFLERPTTEPTPSKESHPESIKSLRWLTEEEKEKVIEIALNTPEAKEAREKYGVYRTGFRWVAIKNNESGGSSLWVFDYEMVDNIPENIPRDAEFYSQVEIYFGEPEQLLMTIAVDLDTEKAVRVDRHGLKILPK